MCEQERRSTLSWVELDASSSSELFGGVGTYSGSGTNKFYRTNILLQQRVHGLLGSGTSVGWVSRRGK